jgi:hypothetical protein
MRTILGALALAITLSGCDFEKTKAIEKENEELKAELKKRDAASQLDMQAKCSKDSKAFVNENYGGEKNTIMLNFTNHYNVAQNKCFVVIEWHYKIAPGYEDWQNDEMLYNVYENDKIGEFNKMTTVMLVKGQYNSSEGHIRCKVDQTTCKTQEEFNNLIGPYLNN